MIHFLITGDVDRKRIDWAKENKLMNTWSEMYDRAKQVQNSRTISPFIEAGGVAAAILTSMSGFASIPVLPWECVRNAMPLQI